MALDDPEGWDVYRQVREATASDADIHLFTNLTGVGNIEVNAFQRLSNVVLQKSVREGFGLVVSEALWKETPVVAGRAGGIPLQLQGGAGGFLVDSVEECADRVAWLLDHPQDAREIAQRGRELVRERFLLTRLIADELRLYAALLGARVGTGLTAAKVGLVGETRDPVCGMRVDPDKAPGVQYQGQRYAFCAQACRQQFVPTPERFIRAAAILV
jgi:trehalose synthase